MASLLHKLLRHQSASRIITAFNKSQSPNLEIPLLTHLHHQPNLTKINPHLPHPVDFIPFSDSPRTEDSISNPSQQLQFYPSFSFGFFLNPGFSTGLAQSEAFDFVNGNSPTIWADSVKKKRKKKMNKHKLRKLRKRLRRAS